MAEEPVAAASEREQPQNTLDSEKEHRNRTITDRGEIVEKYASVIKNEPLKRTKVTKDKANRATVEQVLDPRTLRFLGKIINTGVISRINGCISTGKEANVYHGDHEDPLVSTKEYAVKIYKTSILVFRDRERYVDGEHRFRNTKNQSNPRKMVKVWAEKEFRNLRRLHLCGIPCPEPVELRSHVLVMEYLTKGGGMPSPKLKDYDFENEDEVRHYYHQMLFHMRNLYQKCRLVHADLSEYNSIVHNNVLYIIDVSQSVEPEHPMALDFLRMDIKNVNDFFARKLIDVYPERHLFRYITEAGENLGMADELDACFESFLKTLPLKLKDSHNENVEDEVFRSLHLVRSLNVLDERDFQKFTDGNMATLTDLVPANDSDTDLDTDLDSDDSESESSSDEEWEDREDAQRGKKHEDKDAKKVRKAAVKAAKAEKRKTKMKKHVKKKLVNKRKTA